MPPWVLLLHPATTERKGLLPPRFGPLGSSPPPLYRVEQDGLCAVDICVLRCDRLGHTPLVLPRASDSRKGETAPPSLPPESPPSISREWLLVVFTPCKQLLPPPLPRFRAFYGLFPSGGTPTTPATLLGFLAPFPAQIRPPATLYVPREKHSPPPFPFPFPPCMSRTRQRFS